MARDRRWTALAWLVAMAMGVGGGCSEDASDNVGAPCESADDCAQGLICDVHDGQGTCQDNHDHDGDETGMEDETGDEHEHDDHGHG